jgi:2-polyprenyl-3-methyl-5-hydroxy-6-metoxy-1,4-benzoquinol methylase
MPSIDETTAYFDRRAAELVAPRLVDKWDAVSALLEGADCSGNLLECGAGTGLYTLRFLQSGFHVTSVDLSEKSLEQVATLAHQHELDSQLRTVQGEFVDTLRSSSERYDVIAFIKVLHHFENEAHIAEAFKAAYQCLTPNGRIVVFEPNGDSILWKPTLKAQGPEMWENERNVMLMRRRFFERVLHGLPHATHHLHYRYLIPGSIIKRAAWLNSFDRILCRLPFVSKFALNLCIVVKPTLGPNR